MTTTDVAYGVPPATSRDTLSRPSLAPILRHLALSLLMANVIPAALFYVCLRAGNVWAALIAALVWCYGAMAWRAGTRRPTSGLLLVTVVGLTAKSALAFASGSTFVYFVQPAITDAVIALLFMLSLLTARPIVARLAADFYPMTAEVAGRPRIQRLFWHLTLFWAVLCLIKCVMTLWLLEALPTVTFVAVKSLGILAVILLGTVATVYAAFRVARSEGLLPGRGSPVPTSAQFGGATRLRAEPCETTHETRGFQGAWMSGRNAASPPRLPGCWAARR